MGRGKYADIVDKLPRSFGQDPDRQAKIDALRQNILNTEPSPDDMSSEAIELYCEEITAMLSVLNDKLIKACGGDRHASKFARAYRDVRRVRDLLAEQEKATSLIKDTYEQLVVDQYEVEGTTNLHLEDGDAVRVQYEPQAKVVDKDKLRQWAYANEMENELTIPWQTVNALTKRLLLDGSPEPEGVEAVSHPKVVYTKG